MMVSTQVGHRVVISAALLLCAWSLHGCNTTAPDPRLDSYLGPGLGAGADTAPHVSGLAASGHRVGLVVVQDSRANGAVPPLSDAGLAALAQHTRLRLQSVLPLTLDPVISGTDAVDAVGTIPLQAVASRHHLDQVAIVVYSAVEVDDPQPFALDGNRGGGGAMGRVPGTVMSIYALAEVVVIDAVSGMRVAQSEGRTAVQLEQLARHMDSNAFPAIYRAGSQQRIAAPEDPGEARDATRSLAFHDALEQAAYDLPRQWAPQQGRPPQNRPR